MKKFIIVLMSCSLALAATVVAQQPQEQQTPTKKQQQAEQGQGRKEGKQEANQQQPGRKQHAGRNAAGQENTATNPESTPKTQGAANRKGNRRANAEKNANATGTPAANATPNVSASPGANAAAREGKQGKKERNRGNKAATANASASPAAQSPAPTAAQGQAAATANTQTNTANAQPNAGAGRGKKLDPQTVQTIKSQHTSFRAQPRPDRAPAVTFNQSYRIQGADQWQGAPYEVFRSYHPERHDQGWYRSHYNRVELIGGGYYYWNNGYWYPAWGYSPSEEYYAWDGPIYVGARAERPDQVIADVQAALQQEGYYKGEVDGLLGPLTRQALTAYQADNGLYTTAAIDEPTLSSLGLG